MKFIKNLVWIILISTSVVFLNSCTKDDDILPQVKVEGDKSDGKGQELGSDGEITLYKVNGDNITKDKDFKVTGVDLKFQQNIAQHNEIWELIKKIVPKNQRIKMGEFLIYNGNTSGSSGFVVQIKQDLSSWKMGIAVNFAYEGGFNINGELAYTIIHEFGHVLTLNDTQLVANQNNCNTYNPGEGCAKEKSYINELYQLYWKDIASEHNAAQTNEVKKQVFYTKFKEHFVTRYASTNPPEDIAEVFATFVTKKDKPKGATIAEKKILLMYNRPGLVAFRDHIRKNLSLKGRGINARFKLPEAGAWKQASKIGGSKCRHSH